MLGIEAAIVAEYAEAGTNKASQRIGVAAFSVLLITCSFRIDVCGVVFYSELFPSHIRAKGPAICFCSLLYGPHLPPGYGGSVREYWMEVLSSK